MLTYSVETKVEHDTLQIVLQVNQGKTTTIKPFSLESTRKDDGLTVRHPCVVGGLVVQGTLVKSDELHSGSMQCILVKMVSIAKS